MRFSGTKLDVGFRFFLSALFTLVLSSCSTTARRSTPVESVPAKGDLGVHVPLRQETLSNGLRVILVEDHTVPVVSYQSWFKVGSVDEKPGYTGIAHLFEHLMFKGTPKYPEKQFFMQLEAKGAEVNAFTTRDYTVYYANIVPALLEKVIDMESDRLANLVLNEAVLNSERMVVFEERRMRNDNTPEGRMYEAIWRLAYRRHPYQWPVIGYPQDLARISVEDLEKFFRAHYQPANMAIVIVGDFDAEKTLDWIRRYYGSIPKGERPERKIANEPEQKEERRLVLHDGVNAERMMQAYHVTSATDDDSYALDVLAQVLFGGTSSRAYHRLVEEADVALGVSGSAYTPTYPGLFIISASMKSGQPGTRAEALLDDVIREVQENGVTEEEVKVAVRQLTVSLIDSVRTPYGMGALIGTVHTILGDPEKYSTDLVKYLKVKPDDVRRVAQQYMIPNNRSVVTLAPKVIVKKEAR